MADLFVFALIGMGAGAVARLFYPGREPMKIVGTLLLGMAGALSGGLISWGVWPAVGGQLDPAALLVSLLGALLVLVVWPCVIYFRSVSGSRKPVP